MAHCFLKNLRYFGVILLDQKIRFIDRNVCTCKSTKKIALYYVLKSSFSKSQSSNNNSSLVFNLPSSNWVEKKETKIENYFVIENQRYSNENRKEFTFLAIKFIEE